jgi:hypothetical protein
MRSLARRSSSLDEDAPHLVRLRLAHPVAAQLVAAPPRRGLELAGSTSTALRRSLEHAESSRPRFAISRARSSSSTAIWSRPTVPSPAVCRARTSAMMRFDAHFAARRACPSTFRAVRAVRLAFLSARFCCISISCRARAFSAARRACNKSVAPCCSHARTAERFCPNLSPAGQDCLQWPPEHEGPSNACYVQNSS